MLRLRLLRFPMKKASNTYSLILEELIDLLYDLNEINNIYNEVNFKYKDYFLRNLKKAREYTAFTAECLSIMSGSHKRKEVFLEETDFYVDLESYLDKSDLEFTTDQSLKHIEHVRIAYKSEIDDITDTYLYIIETYLRETKSYLNEDLTIPKELF